MTEQNSHAALKIAYNGLKFQYDKYVENVNKILEGISTQEEFNECMDVFDQYMYISNKQQVESIKADLKSRGYTIIKL